MAKFPLPEGVDNVVMNRDELAEALTTSPNTITSWIGQGMPVLSKGANGKSYELQLAECWAWRRAVKDAEDTRSEEVRRAQANMRLALVGGSDGESIDALDPKTKREIIQAQIMQEQFEQSRNELIKRADVAEVLDVTFSIIRDTLESAPDRVEREEAIPASAVTTIQDIMEELSGDIEHRLAKFWEDRPLHDKKYMRGDLLDA